MALPTNISELIHGNTYVLVTLPAHNGAGIGVGIEANQLKFNSLEGLREFGDQISNQAGNQVGRPAIDVVSQAIHDRVPEMLEILQARTRRADLFEKMDLSNQSRNRAKYLDPLIDIGWVSMEFPQERTHPNQKYQTTNAGKRILALLTIAE